MIGICRLKNRVQDYAWGSTTAIPELLGRPNPEGKPQAELWMGAHPKAPSRVLLGERWVSLPELIEQDPESILGAAAAEKFGGRLPFLFKVLAAARPLSIQCHPNRQQAGEGFARENREQIPLGAFHRNYKDSNHKPEIMAPLTPFWALCGFRRVESMLALLERFRLRAVEEEVQHFKKNPGAEGLGVFFGALMTLEQVRKERVLAEVLREAEALKGAERLERAEALAGTEAIVRAATPAENENPDLYQIARWVLQLHEHYPGDIGVLAPIILNLVHLLPGEALFLEAGVLHAYLDGLGIELMANSDNVIRGGLTPKHMDVPELLKILSFQGADVVLSADEPVSSGVVVYSTPAAEFSLSRISLRSGAETLSPTKRSVEIIICVEGEAEVRDLAAGTALTFCKGESLLIPASVSRYRLCGQAKLYKAAVPE